MDNENKLFKRMVGNQAKQAYSALEEMIEQLIMTQAALLATA